MPYKADLHIEQEFEDFEQCERFIEIMKDYTHSVYKYITNNTFSGLIESSAHDGSGIDLRI